MTARPFVFKLSSLETGTDTLTCGFNASRLKVPGYPNEAPVFAAARQIELG
jgi:hypothetical protein